MSGTHDLQARVWDDGDHDGPTNMARDAALLDQLDAVTPFLARVYGWSSPWVTLGRFQRAERALARDCPFPWTIRPTGGKGVYHGHDVTLGLAARIDWLGTQERQISHVYRKIVRPVVQAMTAAGVPCALAEETRFVRSSGHAGDCFAHVSPNDIVDPRTGLKVCGCALKVTDSAVLVQASIPVGRPDIPSERVFAGIRSEMVASPLDRDSFVRELKGALESR